MLARGADEPPFWNLGDNFHSSLAAVTISGISSSGPDTVANAAPDPTPKSTMAVPMATSNCELELIMAVIAVSS